MGRRQVLVCQLGCGLVGVESVGRAGLAVLRRLELGKIPASDIGWASKKRSLEGVLCILLTDVGPGDQSMLTGHTLDGRPTGVSTEPKRDTDKGFSRKEDAAGTTRLQNVASKNTRRGIRQQYVAIFDTHPENDEKSPYSFFVRLEYFALAFGRLLINITCTCTKRDKHQQTCIQHTILNKVTDRPTVVTTCIFCR